jgi:hypothetical protein
MNSPKPEGRGQAALSGALPSLNGALIKIYAQLKLLRREGIL